MRCSALGKDLWRLLSSQTSMCELVNLSLKNPSLSFPFFLVSVILHWQKKIQHAPEQWRSYVNIDWSTRVAEVGSCHPKRKPCQPSWQLWIQEIVMENWTLNAWRSIFPITLKAVQHNLIQTPDSCEWLYVRGRQTAQIAAVRQERGKNGITMPHQEIEYYFKLVRNSCQTVYDMIKKILSILLRCVWSKPEKLKSLCLSRKHCKVTLNPT